MQFDSPELEQAFQLRRNQHLMRQDRTWAFFWMAFAAAHIGKARTWEQPWRDLLLTAAWIAFMPALILLQRWRPAFYLQNRIPLITTCRITRILIMAATEVHQQEAAWVGSATLVPSTLLGASAHLFWKAYALAFSALGFVLPLRLMVPTALFNLAVKLGSQAHRCRLECGMRGTGELLAAATRSGSCPATASLAADAAQRYYSTVVSWLRSATLSAPLLHRLRLDKASLPAGWAWTALRGTCLAQCFSVHGWQQAVFGTLLPVALVWRIEERLRIEALDWWQQQHDYQQQQVQEGQAGGEPPADPRVAAAAAACQPPRPLPGRHLAIWMACTAWALWLLLEAVLL